MLLMFQDLQRLNWQKKPQDSVEVVLVAYNAGEDVVHIADQEARKGITSQTA